MVDIFWVKFAGVLAAGISAITFLRWVDVVIGGIASVIVWALFGIMATNAERVTRCCVQDASSDEVAILGFGFAAVMLIFTLKPSLVSLDPRQSPADESGGP